MQWVWYNDSTIEFDCKLKLFLNKTYNADKFDWNEEQIGVIMGSFYIGYVITHVPGGIFGDSRGGKYILSLGIASTGLFTILTPYFIRLGRPFLF